jgi:lipopolysaccharide export system protein LptC
MRAKIAIQLLLILIVLFITFLIVKYNYKSANTVTNKNLTKLSKNQNSSQNLIRNIKYTSNNANGNFYEIKADTGMSKIDNPDVMYLTNVTGIIVLKNAEKVNLKSDFANFNSNTFETTFFENVIVNRAEETVLGDSLYFVLNDSKNGYKNLIKVKDNVVILKPGYNLKADILEIDLVTKNSKIFMHESDKKVKIKSSLNN